MINHSCNYSIIDLFLKRLKRHPATQITSAENPQTTAYVVMNDIELLPENIKLKFKGR